VVELAAEVGHRHTLTGCRPTGRYRRCSRRAADVLAP
jgi:hypothetical protein